MQPLDVMSNNELAEYLQLEETALTQLVRQGRIPGEKYGSKWRFHREKVDQWNAAFMRHRDVQASSSDVEAAAGQIRSFDKDEHAELIEPWDIELNQISSGEFSSALNFVTIPGMIIYEESWLLETDARGTSPEGLVMMGTNASWNRTQTDWCGKKIDDRSFACTGPGGEIDFHTQDNCCNAVLLIETDLFTNALGEEAVELICNQRHFKCSANAGQLLVATILGIARRYSTHPELLDDSRELHRVRSTMLENLSNCFANRELGGELVQSSLRRSTVRRAIEYLADTSKPITMVEWAKAAGASQRTLEYGFQEVFGVTPKAYIRLYRLNKAHRDLASADPDFAAVTDIAMKWGFFHPGRFSVMHHKLFGETPSTTLRRAEPTYQLSPSTPQI